MSMKTNKSFLKRVKVTKKGKILVRKTGQNHFNAKENSSERGAKGRKGEFHMTNKERSRFLINIK
ncbi:50S ribosomal protein L35 [Candidatus Parcubacteria bacterium]|nr:50S ribosomal protein L35 [Candidatus Parcubacteria bacterium]